MPGRVRAGMSQDDAVAGLETASGEVDTLIVQTSAQAIGNEAPAEFVDRSAAPGLL
jgi:hypothetical protein